MSRERQCRFIAVVVFVLMAVLPASEQEARLNRLDDYVNKAILDRSQNNKLEVLRPARREM